MYVDWEWCCITFLVRVLVSIIHTIQPTLKISPKSKIITATTATLRKIKFIYSLYLQNVTNFIFKMKCCFIWQCQLDKKNKQNNCIITLLSPADLSFSCNFIVVWRIRSISSCCLRISCLSFRAALLASWRRLISAFMGKQDKTKQKISCYFFISLPLKYPWFFIFILCCATLYNFLLVAFIQSLLEVYPNPQRTLHSLFLLYILLIY